MFNNLHFKQFQAHQLPVPSLEESLYSFYSFFLSSSSCLFVNTPISNFFNKQKTIGQVIPWTWISYTIPIDYTLWRVLYWIILIFVLNKNVYKIMISIIIAKNCLSCTIVLIYNHIWITFFSLMWMINTFKNRNIF